MIKKGNPVAGRAKVERAFKQMGVDLQRAVPVLEQVDYEQALRLSLSGLGYTNERGCPRLIERDSEIFEGVTYTAIFLNYNTYDFPSFESILPSVEDASVGARVLAQNSGGVFNSAINRMRNDFQGYGFNANNEWCFRPLTRTFVMSAGSEAVRERLRENRKRYFGADSLGRKALHQPSHYHRSNRWHKRNKVPQMD